MELELRLPQLDALVTKIEELLNRLENVNTVSARTGVEACLLKIEMLDKKIDALALAGAAPGSESQPEPPSQAEAEPATPKRARMPRVPPAPTTDTNGEDNSVEDEEALRARVEFEAKRTTRQFGIGGTRAAIGRIAGGALRIEDVPASCLPALLSALQALG